MVRACNLSFKYWWAPLHVAVQNGHEHIVDALINHSRAWDVSSHGLYFCDPLSHAELRWNAEATTFTALHVAICSKEYGIARTLVLTSANQAVCTRPMAVPSTQAPVPGKENALHNSTLQSAKLEFIELLLQNGLGTHVKDRDYSDQVPIAIAIENKRWDTVAILIKYGANINLPGPSYRREADGDWASPLVWKIEAGKCTVADVTAASDHGVTALHAACRTPLFQDHRPSSSVWAVGIL